MAEETTQLTRRELRTPRSAAIAGILYSVMIAIIMLLTARIALDAPTDVDRAWLEESAPTIAFVLYLVPLSGYAFLWFTGVVRARIGDREDRFFQTIFFGSAIILVLLTFVWGAVFGAMFGTFALADHLLTGGDIYIFGFTFMNEIMGNYILRIAGVYMTSIGTFWSRVDVAPRWLIIITFIGGLAFMFFAGAFREARYIFPAWVFLVSVYYLVQNHRRSNEELQ